MESVGLHILMKFYMKRTCRLLFNNLLLCGWTYIPSSVPDFL